MSFIVAAILTWIAGFVDAVGFLTFAHIYTANMSGNSVAVGIGLGQNNWPMFILRLWPVFIYLLGLIFGRSLIEVGARLRVAHIASAAFACEVIALTVVDWDGKATQNGPYTQWVSIALLAGAMGIQNAALTRFSSLTLHTGFVTGTLLKFAEQLVKYGTWIWDESFGNRIPIIRTLSLSARQESFRLTCLLISIWIAYVFGAAAGAWGRSLAGTRVLAVPIFCLLLLMSIDLRKPLGQKDERKQTEPHLDR
jgi:uncharacterized membrane protein YoaK (UPF0700 family)